MQRSKHLQRSRHMLRSGHVQRNSEIADSRSYSYLMEQRNSGAYIKSVKINVGASTTTEQHY